MKDEMEAFKDARGLEQIAKELRVPRPEDVTAFEWKCYGTEGNPFPCTATHARLIDRGKVKMLSSREHQIADLQGLIYCPFYCLSFGQTVGKWAE